MIRRDTPGPFSRMSLPPQVGMGTVDTAVLQRHDQGWGERQADE